MYQFCCYVLAGRKVLTKLSQQIVAMLGILVYKFYGEQLREMFGYQEHPYGFYIMAGMRLHSFNGLWYNLIKYFFLFFYDVANTRCKIKSLI